MLFLYMQQLEHSSPGDKFNSFTCNTNITITQQPLQLLQSRTSLLSHIVILICLSYGSLNLSLKKERKTHTYSQKGSLILTERWLISKFLNKSSVSRQVLKAV